MARTVNSLSVPLCITRAINSRLRSGRNVPAHFLPPQFRKTRGADRHWTPSSRSKARGHSRRYPIQPATNPHRGCKPHHKVRHPAQPSTPPKYIRPKKAHRASNSALLLYLWKEEPSSSSRMFNPLSTNFTKCSNTLKQFVGNELFECAWPFCGIDA